MTPSQALVRTIVAAALLGCLPLAGADGSRTLTNRGDPVVAELESTYGRYLASGRAGDAPGFLSAMMIGKVGLEELLAHPGMRLTNG